MRNDFDILHWFLSFYPSTWLRLLLCAMAIGKCTLKNERPDPKIHTHTYEIYALLFNVCCIR